MRVLAVQEVDVGAAGDRHLSTHPLVGAIVARFHGHLAVGLGVSQEDTQTGTDLQTLDVARHDEVVEHGTLADLERTLVHGIAQQPFDVGHAASPRLQTPCVPTSKR